MESFHDWLQRVLNEGESRLEEAPRLNAQERGNVLTLLGAAFDRHRLDVAGPPLRFDATSALGAALALANACWLLNAPDEGSTSLQLDTEPFSASSHLSADVTLRFLPVVYRRARARDRDGKLTTAIDSLLRKWPLSGVLADLEGSPATSLDFDGHAGLHLLYAERFVGNRRPGWLPPAGPAREWVERVFEERHLPIPSPLPNPQ